MHVNPHSSNCIRLGRLNIITGSKKLILKIVSKVHWIVELVEVEGVCLEAIIGHLRLERTGVEIVMDLMHKID